MKKLLPFLLLCNLSPLASRACLILCLKNDSTILVGNHEDWFAKDAAIKIIPPKMGAYGSVIFTFMSEGWAQGGMNEKGLFFDGAFTPFQEVEFGTKRKTYPGYLWQAVLDHCETVEEALEFLSNYQLPTLEEAHIVLADASGHAVILGVNNGRLAIKHREKPYLMQTNFNPWQPELSDEPDCPRYTRAEVLLQTMEGDAEKEMLHILQNTHQDSLTVYSNIYDLKKRQVATYYDRKFDHPIVVQLPEIFAHGSCTLPLSSIDNLATSLASCGQLKTHVQIVGKLVDQKTNTPIPFANIGIPNKNMGTLSDPDGSFDFLLPIERQKDSIRVSCIGYETVWIKAEDWEGKTIELHPQSKVLDEVIVVSKRRTKIQRLGWMGGRDGIVPFDTIQGGAVAALLLEAPSTSFFVKKIQFRLLYNSKDTLKFRLHFYAYDSLLDQPGEELLDQEIILTEQKRFGWARFDLTDYEVYLNHSRFFVGFEWLDTKTTRDRLLEGLGAWERWKKEQYVLGNPKVELIGDAENPRFKYYGNMMNWVGFDKLPPWTGLMVETGKHEKTEQLRTFQRKMSFGKWEELNSTLNTVVVIEY